MVGGNKKASRHFIKIKLVKFSPFGSKDGVTFILSFA